MSRSIERPNVRVAPGYKSRKRGFSVNRAPWGYTVEWYDGKGTYVSAEPQSWWRLPLVLFAMWWEVRK